LAPIPIARIIDTEKLKAGIPSEGLDIGIAEYSNANFFSDRTIFSSDYQTPTDLGLMAELGPNQKLTQYLYRHPGSAPRYKLAVLGAVADSTTVPIEQRQWELDDFVMKDYGTKLFPRAIGYSAGLIDYFSRGHLDLGGCCFDNLADLLLGRTTTWGGSTLSFLAQEDMRGGSVTVVLPYQFGAALGYMVSSSVAVGNVAAGSDAVLSGVSFPSGQAPGPGVQCITGIGCPIILVYRGAFGQENDAVVIENVFLVD
jgi:hypothetical protein